MRTLNSLNGTANGITAIVLLGIGGCSTGGPGLAPGMALQAGRDAIQQASAIHTITETDDGSGNSGGERFQLWSASGMGYRLENNGHIEIYSEKQKKQYRIDPSSGTASLVENQESSLGYEFIKRGRQDENVDSLIVQACNSGATFRDEEVVVSGKKIRRASCQDRANHPISVDYDPQAKRILRTESWTSFGPGSSTKPTRILTTYEYPEQIDPSLFEPQIPHETVVQVASSEQAAAQQCMVNLRDLIGALWDYEAKHPEGLPADLEEAVRAHASFRQSMLRCPLVPDTGNLQYHCLVEPPVRSVTNLKHTVVVFQCDGHPGYVIQGFGDGHCESKKKQ